MPGIDYKPKDHCLLFFILVAVCIVLTDGQAQAPGSSDPNQFDQILRDLDMLTRQQLASQAAVETSTSAPASASTSTTTKNPKEILPITKRLPTSLVKSSNPASSAALSMSPLGSSASGQKRAFTLPPTYDPNRLPRFSRVKPLLLWVNMTIQHINVDKHEVNLYFNFLIRLSI